MKSGDAFYRIGVQHSAEGMPCQDHALVHDDGKMLFIGVADGCSSGGRTDIGARLMNMITVQSLKKIMRDENTVSMHEIVVKLRRERRDLLQKTKELLGLTTADLLATSMFVYSSSHKTFVHVVGDGTVAVVYADGQIDVRRFIWDDNTPYYPAYDLSMKDQFVMQHGGDILGGCLTEERWTHQLDGMWNREFVHTHPVICGMHGITMDLSRNMHEKNISFIALFSDGVDLVDGEHWQEIILRSLAFKQTKGAFVRRRMIKLCKDVGKEHKGPMDDLSCAVMHVDHNCDTQEEGS